AGAPDDPRPGPEGGRDDRLPLERDEGETRLRGRHHPRTLDPHPGRAAHRHRSRGAVPAEGTTHGDRARRRDGPRLDPSARHGGEALQPRRDREPRPERRDGQPRVVACIRRHRGAREPRRDLPAAHAGGDRARGRGPAAARLVPPGLAMGRSLALFTYKMRFFFGPALRGRFGPLAYLALILIFLPQGYAFGYAIGLSLRTLDAEAAILVLSAPLATIFSVGLLYSLGAGVTAHVSEFDFFLTAD